jgi:signal transduction histidine kinase
MIGGWGISAVYASSDARLATASETPHKRGGSLAGQFLTMAFGVMMVGMLAMGTWVSWQIEKSVSEVKAASTALSVSNLITLQVQELAYLDTLSKQSIRDLDRAMERPDLRASIASLKLWGRDGAIVYDNHHELTGKIFPLDPKLRKAWSGAINVEFGITSHQENGRDSASDPPLLQVLVPIHEYETGKVIAVLEFQERAEALKAELTASEWQTWLATGLITLNMMGCLFVIVSGGSKTIDQQRAALKERVLQLSELLDQNQVLQGRVERAAKSATENNERLLRRMGYDLHDGIAQLVSLALLRLDRVQGSLHDRDNLNRIQVVLAEALNDIRNICKGLLLPEVEKLTLRDALMFMIRHHERTTGTIIDCAISDLPDQAPHYVKIALCRFVQEGLNNAFKHAAGQGQQVNVAWDGTTIILEVADNGPGISPNEGSPGTLGLGLSGLRDRIESIGGIVCVESMPNIGTRLRASLPLTPGVSDAA